MPRCNDLTGRVFGRWTVIERSAKRKWLCICDCGNRVSVYGTNLTSGKSRSCGCLSVELARARFTKHDCARSNAVTAEYRAWQHMRDRCFNPKNKSYHDYGGRGITVCQEWRDDFGTFYEYIGPKPSSAHSLDRFPDMNGNYEPGNVRWATHTEQAHNTRRNRRARDGTLICEIRNECGVSNSTYARRIREGWAPERAATTPARQKLPNGMGPTRASRTRRLQSQRGP